MVEPQRKPNRLARQASPYLQQHAHNPVDWYPWGDEAFARASAEDKPIFLSIGYSTCHWCHVMAHESFEDDEVARLLNESFISIKVDREERPDIDHVYMTVCQALTGSGGWPLTILMTPEKKPFFAGTYFPKTRKWGHAGLIDLLTEIRRLWAEERDTLMTTGDRIATAILTASSEAAAPTGGELSAATLDTARKALARTFDPKHGGFGRAPKFPLPHELIFLLREWKRTGDESALGMVETTLRAMRAGGIWDHLGGGFARYSTDREWLVPHFEKMLYDNALLAYAYCEAYQATRAPEYAATAGDICAYVARMLTAPEGGFYSAEDADSEGVEGKFYVWRLDEVKRVLGDKRTALFAEAYDITAAGNFAGANIPNLIGRDLRAVAAKHSLSEPQLEAELAACRRDLFAAREQRVHPHRDDKVLTAWNGLMIAALAKAAAALGDAKYIETATLAAGFIAERLVRDGRLLARYRAGDADLPAYLDDYAFLIWGLQELFMASGETRHLRQASELLSDVLRLFKDAEGGGFFFTGSDAELLISRPKEYQDGALPAGNSVMLLNLIRQYRLTGRDEWDDAAQHLVSAAAAAVGTSPAAHTFFLLGLQLLVAPAQELVLAAGDDPDELRALQARLSQAYLPFAVTVLRTSANATDLAAVAPPHAEKGPLAGRAALYVCEGFACQKPLTEPTEVAARFACDASVQNLH